jgi:hypothetical protein
MGSAICDKGIDSCHVSCSSYRNGSFISGIGDRICDSGIDDSNNCDARSRIAITIDGIGSSVRQISGAIQQK